MQISLHSAGSSESPKRTHAAKEKAWKLHIWRPVTGDANLLPLHPRWLHLPSTIVSSRKNSCSCICTGYQDDNEIICFCTIAATKHTYIIKWFSDDRLTLQCEKKVRGLSSSFGSARQTLHSGPQWNVFSSHPPDLQNHKEITFFHLYLGVFCTEVKICFQAYLFSWNGIFWNP